MHDVDRIFSTGSVIWSWWPWTCAAPRGCPSSMVTLNGGIENLLKQMVPGVKEVVAVEL